MRLTETLEARYILGCAYVSAPSAQVAEALSRRYGLRPPTVIHNVFPWADRGALDGAVLDRRGPALSLYWYSQVVGLDRGLQDAIRAAGLVGRPVQIHLRGHVSEAARAELTGLASEAGVAEALHFHPSVPPEELLSRAAEHDVGLALEQPVSENRKLTVTNKLFFYMLAGLALAASDVPGQRGVMAGHLDAGCLYAPGDHPALAAALRRWADDPAALRAARAASLEAARTRWNWETEQWRLIELVRGLLTPTP